MLAAMRAGTYDVKPLPQTKAPERTWKVEAETGPKSAGGARRFAIRTMPAASATAAASIMLDRIVNDPSLCGRSRERLVVDRNCDPRPRRRRTHEVWPAVVKVLTEGIGELNLRDIDVYRQPAATRSSSARSRRLRPAEPSMEMADRSDLRGRGGAGFPTGRKWSFLPNNGRPRYLVCNCDEAEPGTFKDHMLLEETPHQIIEGILIGSYAIGCHHAFIYIRGEFQDGFEIMRDAVAQARAAGYIGKGICGSDYDLEFTIHRGAGAYICGEETALLNSLEGKRGEPRLKPPFPGDQGALRRADGRQQRRDARLSAATSCATAPEWFAKAGPERRRASRSSRSRGHVKKPGNYEVPLGTTIRS